MIGVHPDTRAAAHALLEEHYARAIGRAERALRANPTDRHALNIRAIAAAIQANASGLQRLKQGTYADLERAARYGDETIRAMDRPRDQDEANICILHAGTLTGLG